ncbi:MAG: PAS domain-containing protein [Bdellovibrionales bacterium]|nr:PAS domain-containing protein [Bdellovibrionales bacterium]
MCFKQRLEQICLSPSNRQTGIMSAVLCGMGIFFSAIGLSAAAVVALAALAFYAGLTLAAERLSSLLDRAICDRHDSNLPRFDKTLAIIRAEQKRTEKALEEAIDQNESLLERYRLLTNNLAAAVVIRDNTQRITYCSPYTEVLTGYPIDDIYESEEDFFLKIVHPDDRSNVERALKVSTVGEPFQFRYRFLHRSGIEMWGETRTVPVLDQNGELLFSLSVTLDMTGTVRYQQQVEEKNRELRDFSYMVSHDLKAPIYTIKGMVHLIQEDFTVDIDESLADAFEHIARAVTKLEHLVKSVLDYSQLSSQEFVIEPVPLTEVIEETRSLFSHELNQKDVSLAIYGELPIVMGDRLRLYQVFSNLVGNAIKYRSTERPLEIRIATTPTQRPHETTIKVMDNGLGIPSDRILDIFRPFQRAHQALKIEGTGIGLACVKRLMEKLGGRIEVSSQEGSGSSFEVTLRTPIN